MNIQIKLGTLRRLSPGCQWLYDPSKAAIINTKWSLNVKIGKVAMPQCECIISKWANPQCRMISGKYVPDINYHLTKSSSMTSGPCPSVSISKTNIHEKSTTNHTSSDRNESLLLKVIVVIWRGYLISSKERACLDVNWCLWDQPPMKGLCPSIG